MGGALFALSAYANLLQHHTDTTERDANTKSIVTWATVAFCGLILAALAMVAFAIGQVWSTRGAHKISGTSALEVAWKTMSNQGCAVQLQQLAQKGDGFIVLYRSSACARQFALSINAEGNVTSIQSTVLPTLAPPKAAAPETESSTIPPRPRLCKPRRPRPNHRALCPDR